MMSSSEVPGGSRFRREDSKSKSRRTLPMSKRKVMWEMGDGRWEMGLEGSATTTFEDVVGGC